MPNRKEVDILSFKVRSELQAVADMLNYERIHSYMKTVHWTYNTISVQCEVPSIDELKTTVYVAINTAVIDFSSKLEAMGEIDLSSGSRSSLPFTRVSIGGFLVEILPWNEVFVGFVANSVSRSFRRGA